MVSWRCTFKAPEVKEHKSKSEKLRKKKGMHTTKMWYNELGTNFDI